MKLNKLLENVTIETINNVDLQKDVEGIYIGDLLSFVMANGEENCLWLTVQRHINVIAVAELVGFSGIIFVENVDPDQETIDRANELSICLLKTSLTAFDLSKEFIASGL